MSLCNAMNIRWCIHAARGGGVGKWSFGHNTPLSILKLSARFTPSSWHSRLWSCWREWLADTAMPSWVWDFPSPITACQNWGSSSPTESWLAVFMSLGMWWLSLAIPCNLYRCKMLNFHAWKIILPNFRSNHKMFWSQKFSDTRYLKKLPVHLIDLHNIL